MQTRLEEIQAIVRNRICSLCSTRTVEGACGAEEPEHCPLQSLFPLVAQAVMATESDQLEPYIDAIHEHVCSVCIDQRLDGSCPQREVHSCALDAHMPEVVEAIEEALGRRLRPDTAAKAPAR
jgi:hypothetical protein